MRRTDLAVGVFLSATLHFGALAGVGWFAAHAPDRSGEVGDAVRVVRLSLPAEPEPPARVEPPPPLEPEPPPEPELPPLSAESPLPEPTPEPLPQVRPLEQAPVLGAKFIHRSPLDYPANARRRNIEGAVVVALRVHESGAPCEIEVVSSSGSSLLDRAALTSIQDWCFDTGEMRRVGHALDRTYRVRVLFELE